MPKIEPEERAHSQTALILFWVSLACFQFALMRLHAIFRLRKALQLFLDTLQPLLKCPDLIVFDLKLKPMFPLYVFLLF
jgi:hypothetical protein